MALTALVASVSPVQGIVQARGKSSKSSKSGKSAPIVASTTVQGPVTCTGANAEIDCCWVERIWQALSPTANKKSAFSGSATACCSQKGVSCSSPGIVTGIRWGYGDQLSGSIPREIGKLGNLQYLYY